MQDFSERAASRRIAGLIGPALLAISATEALNMGILSPNPPVVYLNGSILFVAGLAIVQAHSRWQRNWTLFHPDGVGCIGAGLAADNFSNGGTGRRRLGNLFDARNPLRHWRYPQYCRLPPWAAHVAPLALWVVTDGAASFRFDRIVRRAWRQTCDV